MAEKLKILLLNTQMEAAGAQKAMLVLARGLQALGHKAQVVTMYDKADYVARFRQEYGVDIVDLRMKRPGRQNPLVKLADVVTGLWRLYRLMRRERFDVVQTFSHYSNLVGPVMAWLAGVRVRVSSQRMSLKGAPPWLLRLDRLVTNSSLVGAMVAVSEGTRRFAIEQQGIDPKKLITIHNSIDVQRFAPVSAEKIESLRAALKLPLDALVVLTVARLHPQKGHHFLLQAVPIILQSYPQVRFLFVGEGDLRQELETTTQHSGLQDVVYFLGVRQDIAELLSLSDIFVLPSLWEGLPNSVLEAMAAETPVVATNVDGCPEVVYDGETGILVPPKNVQALAQAILSLLGNPVQRRQLGMAARTRAVREFSEEKNISTFLNLYTQLLANAR